MLERTNTNAVFEVIAAHDTHPITESGPDRLVLLDCIRNEVEFATHDKIRDGNAGRVGFEVAEITDLANTSNELEDAAARTDERSWSLMLRATGARSRPTPTPSDGAGTTVERSVMTLGPRFSELERRLDETGILENLGEYTVTGVDRGEQVDLARLFDGFERREG